MGLEATWSLVDIPADARDAAQAAARREGVSVGEWLTRRILKRFSELNVREQEDAFVALRNHVAQLADRLDRVEVDSRGEPMREALKKLHHGLTRLNDELVRTAGHSAIQISQLSTSLESLNGRVNELREHDAESRGAFERRMGQLQEFVDGMNLRHSAETRTISSRMDSLGETLAESRHLITEERTALERLEENLAKTDTRYSGAFRAVSEKFDSLSSSIQGIGSAASQSSAALEQRIASLRAELENADVRNAEEKQLATARLEKLQGKVDDVQADVTGMCGALDRRVLLLQQAVQSLDSRHTEMSHSLTRSVESVAAQTETVRAGSARNTANLETRLANLESAAKKADLAGASAENRIAAIEHRFSTSGATTAADSRLAAMEHQLSDLTGRTSAAMSAASALLPKTEAIEARLEQLNAKLDTEVEGQQHAIEQLKADLLQQTLNALGDKLEMEGRKQQAAIADLQSGLLGKLSHAFDERAQAEEQKQHDAMAQLQSNFAAALQSLGETFEIQARRQQEAIAELKASLAAPQPASQQPQPQEADANPGEPTAAEQTAPAQTLSVHSDTPIQHAEESTVFLNQQAHAEPLPEVTTFADQSAAHAAAPDEHIEVGEQPLVLEQPAAVEPPPFSQPEAIEHPDFDHASLGGMEPLASAAVMARDNAGDTTVEAPSYLSAARQSLQTATLRGDGDSTGKELFGLRFLKSLSLASIQKGQTTSYALMGGIGLVAILAIVVGATELMSRSEPVAHVQSFARPVANQTRVTRVTKYVAPKSVALPSAASVVAGQDRTAVLAKGGNPQAQLLLGLRELAKNEAADAAPWLERAAVQGLPVAQYRMATLYASGKGVPEDKAKAFRWYLAAAQAGNRKAMSNLAVAYAQGDGTTKNPQEAGRWFLKAAQLGLADAQFDLAILYERGLGVPQNLTDAYRWYVIAAKAGDKESKDRVEALGSQLAPEDRAAAETAAAEFKPLPMNTRANEPQ
ncbi:MAG TPA: hypothetical protein VKR31_02055 [Rhizomicrobium sp.]|nr:hypothetical protein [Rhizomicrobium sp.]